MGIEYSAKIVVGLPYDELEDQDLLDDEEIECFPPYYDADRSSCIVGITYVRTNDYSYREFEFNPIRVDELLEEFKAITGQVGRLYLTPVGR